MEEKKKLPAGRPPKNLIRKLENRKGIHSTPIHSQNVFELCHDNPDIFKSLFESCKRIKDKVEFVVHPKGVRFYFETESKNTVGIADLLGHRVVRYYCEINNSYYCAADSLIKILKLKKDSEKIIFSIARNSPYSLNITFLFEHGCSECWSIGLDPFEPADFTQYESYYSAIDNYPLNLTMPWSKFKDSVNSWKQFAPGEIIFEKDPATNLTMSFREGQISCTFTVVPGKNYKVNYTGQDLFAVSIPILNLLSFSTSSDLSDFLTIYLKEETIAVIVAKLDESFKTKKEPIPDTETIVMKFFVPVKE